MTIKEAKQVLKEMIIMYLQKDDRGNYIIPYNCQRPAALIGPAGIGKTEAAKQVAEELNIGFLSYTITHQTRQSAVGLPVIKEAGFCGNRYQITEYTMSDIIAAVYKRIEGGEKEGILFLDEFNCVSETLAPALLEFLQNKTFGNHKLPRGWIIVVAGNPAEYNKSVKEIDIVTQDRLRHIPVRADLECWKEYAIQKCMHPIILNYLQQCPKDFYVFEKTKEGQSIVTPRAWEDLSVTLKSYEKLGFEVTENVVAEVIQCRRVVQNFMNCYQLYRTIAGNGEINQILAGKNLEALARKYGSMNFNEKWAITTVLIDQSAAYSAKLENRDENFQEKYEFANKIITNCLRFLKMAFGNGPETEVYMNNLAKNKDLATVLLHSNNSVYEKLCEEMLFDNTASVINRELKKVI